MGVFSGVAHRDSSTSSSFPSPNALRLLCVGVLLLLRASMLVLMGPAVQTLGQLAKRDRSLC